MPFKGTNRSFGLTAVLPWVFIAVVALLAYHVIGLVDKQTFRAANEASQEYVGTGGLDQCLAQLPSNLPLTRDQVRTCLQGTRTTAQVFDQAVRPRIDELKWLLTIIATVGGFFAVAQGAAAWFSAQIYTKQAEEGLKAISSAQDAIKARYPLFEHVEAMRKQAIAALNNVFTAASKAPDSWTGNTEALDWQDNLFRSLDVEARQLLLSVESFASMDLDPGFSAEEHAEILRKLSLFYRAKFLYEDSVSGGTFGDLERAESYLILASKKKADFTIKNDLGSLYGTMFTTILKRCPENTHDIAYYMQKSETVLRESLRLEPNQQRAHHGLAVIFGRYRKRYDEAIAELELALQRRVWQREASDYMRTIMYYNMGCYQSRLLQRASQGKQRVSVADAQAVLGSLGKATRQSYVRRPLIKTDFEDNDGDLTGLLSLADPELKKKMAELRAALERNADQYTSAHAKAPAKDQLTVGATIAEALRLIRKRLFNRV
jgi:hypothetical protein